MALTSLAFLVAFVAGLFAAFLVRPIYGLYTYVAVFYLHPPSRWWGGMLPDLRWSLIAAAVTLVAVVVARERYPSKYKLSSSAIFILFALYTGWMWAQLAFVPSSNHLNGVILFTKYVVLIYLIVRIIDNEKDFLGFCMAHVLGCAYFGWLIFLAPDAGRLEGVGGPGVDDANTLGMHIGTGLFFASFLLFQCTGKLRLLVLLTIPFIANGLIQTETRGAIVGVVLGGFAAFIFKPRSIRRSFYGLAILGVLGFLVIANETFLQRMSSMTAAVSEEQEWDGSAESRIHIAKAQWEMFLDHPLGVGHQGTAFLSRNYLDSRWLATNSGDRASHNTVMSVLVDQGIIGIILFFLLALSVIRFLIRLKGMDMVGLSRDLAVYRAMLAGALVTIFGAGMFAQFLKAEVQVWCLALLIVLWNLAQSSLQPKSGSKHIGSRD